MMGHWQGTGDAEAIEASTNSQFLITAAKTSDWPSGGQYSAPMNRLSKLWRRMFHLDSVDP